MRWDLRWDIFCRVIDNHGDLGVCWRLARDLAGRGAAARLWVDDARALAWMAPGGAAGVEVRAWDEASASVEPGEVVVEAFGCDPPEAFVARMHRPQPPAWINLEYLSAESYVERSHGLPSPVMSGPGRGLTKWFFYPGFTSGTGGLLREPDLMTRQSGFDSRAWLAAHATLPHPQEQVVSLFCYAHAPFGAWLAALSRRPTLLLVTSGAAATGLSAQLPTPLVPGQIQRHGLARIHALPALTQVDYDHLLWSADLNFVRGEDSFVRAQWAARPFVWHIYQQDDDAHAAKLQAFLDAYLTTATALDAPAIRRTWQWWNGLEAAPPSPDWGSAAPLLAHSWRKHLLQQDDLTTALTRFVASQTHPPRSRR